MLRGVWGTVCCGHTGCRQPAPHPPCSHPAERGGVRWVRPTWKLPPDARNFSPGRLLCLPGAKHDRERVRGVSGAGAWGPAGAVRDARGTRRWRGGTGTLCPARETRPQHGTCDRAEAGTSRKNKLKRVELATHTPPATVNSKNV